MKFYKCSACGTIVAAVEENCGPVHCCGKAMEVLEPIPAGHKLALIDIPAGAEVVKYGVRIGLATADIPRGGWVHLHVMRSAYDERSSHLDAVTGTPKDIRYD